MVRKFAFLWSLTLMLGFVGSSVGFGATVEVRIATGSDDAEQHLNAGMDVTSTDLEMPYEDDGTPSATDEQLVCIRYLIPVAKGTQIMKAHVEFTVDETKGGTRPVNLIIEGQLAVNPPTFTTAANNLTGRAPWTKAQVKWAVENWTTVGQKSRTPDIAAILQEIINQDGWASGNALVLAFRDDKSNPSTGIRCADAYEDGATLAPVLRIEVFDPTASAPSPANGALGVTMPLFNWTAGDGAIFHNVYFGTSPDLTEANRVAQNQPFAMYYHVPGLQPGVTYYWRVDEIEATGKVTAGPVWSFSTAPVNAYNPIPPNGAMYQSADVDLAWTAGQGAVSHELYFGTNKDAVSAGDASAFKGKLAAATFDPGKLALETTYYWRVDEIEAGGQKSVGDVWSFTSTIPGLGAAKRELWNNITGTALADLRNNPNFPGNPDVSDTVPNFESPTNIADNYGGRLSAWLHVPATGDYTFWLASDDYGELRLGPDPDSATVIATVPGWSNAREWDKYPQQKSAPIRLEAGRYYLEALWKEGGGGDNCSVGWQGPGIPQRILIAGSYLMPFEALWAYGPRPVHGATSVTQTPELRWTAGTKAKQHDVYFGEEAQAVASATTSSSLYKGRQNGNTFNPGELEWDKTYYWRVDEINTAEAGSPWKGAVWSFTTANFLVVDDMESYTDDEGNRIYEIWVDGWTNGTGSTVGNLQAPFAERTIIHGGRQAMPLDYNNTKSPFYSEAEATFAPLQNWTVNGVTDLSLWFRGNPVSYLDKGNGAFTVGASGHDIWDAADDFRFVYKRLSGNGSVTVKVESLVNTNAWAKAGVMIRESLDDGSPMAYMIQSFSSGVSFGWRLSQGATCGSATQAGIVAPQWVKLTRTGNAFTAQYSANGTTWTDIRNADGTVTTTTVNMAGTVYIGLCVTSHNTAATTTAEFSGAATTGGVTGAWQQVWIGDDPDRTNGAAGLYLAVEDSTGKSVVMTHPDPTAANANAWTEWKIPLSSLTGVNLARVKKLYLGVGDRKAPVPGGAGRVYLDDIRVTKP